MSMLAKTDSEVSSLSQSSPGRSSPRRPVYYVQSPSRDSSQDGEKTTNSFHSSPLQSPLGSPPHSHSNSSLGPHSRESASTRFSGSRKTSASRRKSTWRPWKDQFHAIEEEGLLDPHDASQNGLTRRCYSLAFVLGFIALFSVFSLILWGASRTQKPTISVKSIVFNQFVIQAGEDASGVPTSMVSMNSSVKLTFRNTATFFGVHVTSTPLDLTYYQLTLATGTIAKFYQSRKSQRSMRVTLIGSGIPLYGGGASLSSVKGAPAESVALKLRFVVRWRAKVLGELVKPKFYKKVECMVDMDPKKMNRGISLKNKCSYQ
ncbi:uncharacterized protein LOC129312171 [Prosopis cineraria]|uniref:uncharacterized protein LOC129312171 n=1 Tax=Prosopis cineraria TaxID=364024 RepID=UPI00240F90B5|nr:uncharacterized protein LOC129312171 [Prosopis cineraria]